MFGADFPRERFLQTPLRAIYRVLQEITDIEQRQANTASISTARLTALVLEVAHAFSGSKRRGKRPEPREFLPYPEWKPAKAESDGPDEPTKFVLLELVRSRRIPMYVYLALSTGQVSEN